MPPWVELLIWGEPIFATADAATAAIDTAIATGLLAQEAVDDHQVRTHFPTGPDLVENFADAKRRIPEEAPAETARHRRTSDNA